MIKYCSRCKIKIPWWRYSEEHEHKLLCAECAEKTNCTECTKKKEVEKPIKKEFDKEVESPYSVKLLIMGLFILGFCVYYAFLMDSGLFYKANNYQLKVYEARNACNNPVLISYYETNVQEACRSLPTNFIYAMIGLFVGLTLTIIGIIKNFIIYNNEYKKDK